MSNRFTFRNFLKDLGMRVVAASVVIGIFFGLSYVKRTNLLGLSGLLEGQLAFFAAAFMLIGLIAGAWVLYQVRK